MEHNRNPKKDYWTEAVAITTSNNSLGPTEISYLEHRFCQLANEAKRYDVKNENDPTLGNPSEEKMSELEDFIDYARIVVGMLGHKVFVPLIDTESNMPETNEYFCTRNNAMASGIQTSDGFVVRKGSVLSRSLTKSCPEYVIKKREQYKGIIDDSNTLTEDVLFSTPSGASSFVCGASTNSSRRSTRRSLRPWRSLQTSGTPARAKATAEASTTTEAATTCLTSTPLSPRAR